MDHQGFISRLQELMQLENINPSNLAKLIQVQRSTFSHILSGRNKPSVDLLIKIHQAFPSYSVDWMLFGGQKPSASEPTVKSDLSTNKNIKSEPPANQEVSRVTDVNNNAARESQVILLHPNGTYNIYRPA